MNQVNQNKKIHTYFSKRSSEHIKQAVPKNSGTTKPTGQNPIFRTCFIGGLHIRLKEGELLKHMKCKFPEIDIESIKFIPSRKEKEANRGFGFMTLKNDQDYQKVLKLSFELKGKLINFRKAKSYNELKSEESQIYERRVIVKNLPKSADDGALLKVLKKKGWAIERCYVIRDSNTLKSKRIAFVDFCNAKDLKKCLKRRKGLEMSGNMLTVEAFDLDKSKTVTKKQKIKSRAESDQAVETSQSGASKDKEALNQINEAQKEEKTSRWIFLYPSKKRFLNEEVFNYRTNKKERTFFNSYSKSKQVGSYQWTR